MRKLLVLAGLILMIMVGLDSCVLRAVEYVQVDEPFVFPAGEHLVLAVAEGAFVVSPEEGNPGCYRLNYGWDNEQYQGTAVWTGEQCEVAP